MPPLPIKYKQWHNSKMEKVVKCEINLGVPFTVHVLELKLQRENQMCEVLYRWKYRHGTNLIPPDALWNGHKKPTGSKCFGWKHQLNYLPLKFILTRQCSSETKHPSRVCINIIYLSKVCIKVIWLFHVIIQLQVLESKIYFYKQNYFFIEPCCVEVEET